MFSDFLFNSALKSWTVRFRFYSSLNHFIYT
jgi:hypothetical protein